VRGKARWRARPNTLLAARLLFLFLFLFLFLLPWLTASHADMHRPALPAAHAARLPTHLLRRVPEGVVRLPGLDGHLDPPVHLPGMPCLGARDQAKRHRHDAARHVHTGTPAQGKERSREAGRQGQVQLRRRRHAQAAEARRPGRRRGAQAARRGAAAELEGGGNRCSEQRDRCGPSRAATGEAEERAPRAQRRQTGDERRYADCGRPFAESQPGQRLVCNQRGRASEGYRASVQLEKPA
jgi:hypothetical protein